MVQNIILRLNHCRHQEIQPVLQPFAILCTALVCAALCILFSVRIHAEGAVCILPANASIYGTPCTNAAKAFDGKHTLIRLDSCAEGTLNVNVVFQQDPAETGSNKSVGGFQTAVVYDSNLLHDPVCNPDPSHYFYNQLANDCPNIYKNTTGETFIMSAAGDITGDKWPESNPNFIMTNLVFQRKNIPANVSPSLCFLTSKPGILTKVINLKYLEMNDINYPAVITCAPGPVIINNENGIDIARTVNDGVYDVSVISAPRTTLQGIHLRACSSNTDCGDIVDWTALTFSANQTSLSKGWKLPDSLWQALPEGISYISLRATDSAGATSQSGPMFYVRKKRVPSAPSGLVAISMNNEVQLSWSAPALNTDGTALTNLAGFHVYVPAECSADSAPRLNVEMAPATATHFKVPDASITPYTNFVVTAVNANGSQSGWSECVSAIEQMELGITGTLVRPDSSGGTVKDAGYPLRGMPGYTVIIMAGDTELGTAVTGEDGSFLLPFPDGIQGATITVHIVIPEESGFMAKSGSFIAGRGVRDAATITARSDGVTNAGVFRLGFGPPVGDVNCDGTVEITDAILLKKGYGKELGVEGYDVNYDINGDQVVDVADFVLLKQSYGQESGTVPFGGCAGR